MKFIKGTSQCDVSPHAQVGSKHCQHLEKVISKSSASPPMSSDCLNLQTKLNHKSIQTSANLQNSSVPPLSPENWGFPLGLMEVHRRSGCSFCWPRSHTWLFFLMVQYKIEWQMHQAEIENVNITHIADISSDTRSILAHLHHYYTNFLTFSQRHDRSLLRAPTTVLVCSPCCCSRLRSDNRKG